jgi:hypothetical protein
MSVDNTKNVCGTLLYLIQKGKDDIINNPSAVYPEGYSAEKSLAVLDECEEWVKGKLK